MRFIVQDVIFIMIKIFVINVIIHIIIEIVNDVKYQNEKLNIVLSILMKNNV